MLLNSKSYFNYSVTYLFIITESEAGECTYYIVAPMDIIEAKVNFVC